MPLLGNLLEQGVREMVRIWDGRMSGTAYGTVVLHGAREAAARGRLGKARTGDMRDAAAGNGSTSNTVGQANTGGALDVLLGSSGDRASRESD